MNSVNPLLDDDSTRRPVGSSKTKTIAVVSSGVVLALILFIVVISLDSATDQNNEEQPGELEKYATPAPLPDETGPTVRGPLEGPGPDEVEVTRGKVQVVDEDNKVSQQYQWTRLEPAPEERPPGWIEISDLRAEFFLSNRDVIALSGDHVEAYRPKQRLERGVAQQNVIIHLFEDNAELAGTTLAGQTPAVRVETEEASFDNIRSELHCPGDVHVQTAWMEFKGSDLTLRYNELLRRIEHLRVEQVDEIRLIQQGDAGTQRASAEADQPMDDSSDAPSQTADATIAGAASGSTETQRDAEQSDESQDAPQFYRLTLNDDIVIRQGEPDAARIARGDRLVAIFSAKSKGFGRVLTSAPRIQRSPLMNARTGRWAHHAMTTMQLLMTSVVAAQPTIQRVAPEPSEDDVYITMAGSMLMTPVDDADSIPSSPDASRVDLIGSPASYEDAQNSQSLECAQMQVHSPAQRFEFFGSGDYPLVLASKDTQATSDFLWIDNRKGIGAFDAATRLVQNDGISIECSEGVDLNFAESERDESSLRLSNALFKRDVRVRSEELDLDAVQLEVSFFVADAVEGDDQRGKQEIDRSDPVKQLVATGDVSARGLTEQQRDLQCEQLVVDMARDEFGRSSPVLIVAAKDVQAADAEQMVWAQRLQLDCAPAGAEASDDVRDHPLVERVKVTQVTAETDVQALMADGTRVFADTMTGAPGSRSVLLQGDQIAVVQGTMLFERSGQLQLTDVDNVTTIDGAGELRIFTQPLCKAVNEQLEYPHVEDQTVESIITWSKQAVYDAEGGSGDGLVDLIGDVTVHATPADGKVTDVSAGVLTLILEESPNEVADARVSSKRSLASERSRPRRVRVVHAKDDAKLEHHDPYPSGQKRVFGLRGQDIEYDVLTGDAIVQRDGVLLMHDPVNDADEKSSSGSKFGAKGSTGFYSIDQLNMKRVSENEFTITMDGDLEVIHVGLDEARTTMACDRIVAQAREVESAQRIAQQPSSSQTATIGPALELRTVKALGRVFVDAPQFDAECDVLEYNVETGIAEMSALEGRLMRVLYEDQFNTVNARQARWDLNNGKLEISMDSGRVTW